jgi:hypothetical protein
MCFGGNNTPRAGHDLVPPFRWVSSVPVVVKSHCGFAVTLRLWRCSVVSAHFWAGGLEGGTWLQGRQVPPEAVFEACFTRCVFRGRLCQ